MSVVLMYHGIYPDNDSSAIDAEDQPYAVSLSDFRHQLDVLAEYRVALYSAGRIPDVVITFDDGHASNLYLAAAELVARNLSAYFFVTTDFCGQRANFLSPDELSELSNLPGLCVGSHGMTHRFFDDMSEEESENELISSRQTLENICGAVCRSISFPGGRFLPQTLDQLIKAGYTQWFGSEIGLIYPDRFNDDAHSRDNNQASVGSPSASDLISPHTGSHRASGVPERWSLRTQQGRKPLERVAVRHTTHLPEFRRIIGEEPAYFRRKRLNSQVKQIARRVIGNRLYHGLYKSIATR